MNDLFQSDLEEAKEKLFNEAETKEGGICPCCDRFTKIYTRKFNKAMAESLVWLFSETVRGAVDKYGYTSIGDNAPRYVIRNGGSLASCRWWGFVEKKENSDEKKHSSGTWRITVKGKAFVRGDITIASHIKTYNTENIKSIEDNQTTIQQALGRPFNYKELMMNIG